MEFEVEMEMEVEVAMAGRNRDPAYMRCPRGRWELGAGSWEPGRWPWELVAGGRRPERYQPGAAILLSDTVTWSPGHCTVGQGKQQRKRNLELHSAPLRYRAWFHCNFPSSCFSGSLILICEDTSSPFRRPPTT